MCSLMTGIIWSGDQASDGWGWENDGGGNGGMLEGGGGWVLLSQELGGNLGGFITGRLQSSRLTSFFCLFIKCSKEEEDAAISQC